MKCVQAIIAALAMVSAGSALAQEDKILLKDGPGRDKVMSQCAMCHSLDYVQMNSRFLDRAGWTASVTKMINVFGAPIPKEDVDTLVDYLTQNYGKPAQK
jgi:hypothetical protein